MFKKGFLFYVTSNSTAASLSFCCFFPSCVKKKIITSRVCTQVLASRCVEKNFHLCTFCYYSVTIASTPPSLQDSVEK